MTESATKYWRTRKRGPSREIVFEETDKNGSLTETLECGHQHPAPKNLTQKNYYGVGSRYCEECLKELQEGERPVPEINKKWAVSHLRLVHSV